VSKDVIWSVALSIPVSIGSGLAVPFIIRWFERHGRRKAEKERERIRLHFLTVWRYHSKPSEYTMELIIDAIFITASFCTIILGAIEESKGFIIHISHPSVALYATHPLVPEIESFFHQVVGAILMFGGAVYASRDMSKVVEIYGHVRMFDDFVKTVPEDILEEFRTQPETPTTDKLQSPDRENRP
jgi:hypothetical protein